MRVMVSGFLVAMLVCGGVLLAACGGGGGGGSTPTSAFNGQYGMYIFEATAGPPEACYSLWGGVDVDGSGSPTGVLRGNEDGNLTGAQPVTGWNTRIESDGSFHWQHTSMPGTDIWSGTINSGGEVGLVMPVHSGQPPSMMIMSRRSNYAAAPNITATYRACGYSFDLGTARNTSWWGTMTFDGSGGGEREFSRNMEGAMGITLSPPAISYTLTPAGNLTIDAPGMGQLTGDVYADGEFIVVGGSTTSGDDPILLAMVRPSTAASVATLSGTYGMVGLRYDRAGPAFASMTGTANADGAGNISVVVTENNEGTVVTGPPDTATYTVEVNGRVRLDTGGGERYVGGVSPSGKYVVLAGATSPGTDPSFYVLVRR
ncbi:MAG: hypothetical protein QNJ90_12440 [Planctomycetota bacterium]|nr:hypothetical protein [Planctomycetota bacterium]